MPIAPPQDLDPTVVAELHQRATEAARNAYAPFSGFRVGAALLLAAPEPNAIVSGCNVENASYRLTTCAEQTAIVSAVARFGPTLRIRAVAVVNLNNTASQPCGACRQTILEFSTPETLVFYPASSGEIAHCTIADLLPAGFCLSHP